MASKKSFPPDCSTAVFFSMTPRNLESGTTKFGTGTAGSKLKSLPEEGRRDATRLGSRRLPVRRTRSRRPARSSVTLSQPARADWVARGNAIFRAHHHTMGRGTALRRLTTPYESCPLSQGRALLADLAELSVSAYSAHAMDG